MRHRLFTSFALFTLVGCANPRAARDAAGATSGAPVIPIPNARQAQVDVLAGGLPTDEHLRQAKALGYRAVIDLRTVKEAGAADSLALARSLGFTAIGIPVDVPAGVTEENARALANALAVPENRPAIVHCASGNRAGALLALKTFYVDGKGAVESMEFGTRAGLTGGLEQLVNKKLQDAEAARAKRGP